MDRSSEKKINKATEILNGTIAQLDNIFKALHPKIPENTSISSAHGTMSGTDHILGHKTSLNKFQGTKIISSISDHNGMKLEITEKETRQK